MFTFGTLILAFALGMMIGVAVMCLMRVASPDPLDDLTPARFFAQFGGAVAWRGRSTTLNSLQSKYWQYVDSGPDAFPDHYQVQALGVICDVKSLDDDQKGTK